MRIRVWEGLVAALALLFAVALLIGAQWVGGIVLAAVVLLLLAQRARVIEREMAGGFSRTRGRLELVQTAALLTIYVVICGFFVVISRDHWTRDTHGTVAMWA